IGEDQRISREHMGAILGKAFSAPSLEQRTHDPIAARIGGGIHHLHVISSDAADPGVGAGRTGVQDERRNNDGLAQESLDCPQRALVRRLREDEASLRGSRAAPHVLEETHVLGVAGYLACSASATAGCTSPSTSPPNRATSRTRLALMYVVSRDGTMNTVSRPGMRCRFMSAI